MKNIYRKHISFLAILILSLQLQSYSQIFKAKAEPDSIIAATVAKINPDSLQQTVQALQDMGTRFMIADNRREVATWLMNRFISIGITDVQLDSGNCFTNINYQNLSYDTTTMQYNVEARIEGTEFPDEEILVLGHYDNVVPNGNPEVFAPGADDNASGTASLIEIARVILESGFEARRTVVFLATAAEELMYSGDSGAELYATAASAAGKNIVMVINNDMIAYDTDTWTVNMSNHIGSESITGMAIQMLETYTTLNYELWEASTNYGADIQPFFDVGYSGVYFMEHVFNPNYHTETDLIDYCDFDYHAEVTKVSCALIMNNDMTVAIGEAPDDILLKIYPNPANSVATLHFEIAHKGHLNVSLYSPGGKPVTNILSRNFSPGTYTERLNTESLTPGVYYCSLQSNAAILTTKLIVLH